MPIQIRPETEEDFISVNDIVYQAFLAAEHSDGNEHKLVAALRRSSSFVPSLSLVAYHGEQVVGHVLLTEAKVGHQIILTMAPFAVAPSWQKKGVGTLLIKEAHLRASQLGYQTILVLGDPAYYSRFGYQPASQFGISAPFDVPDAYFMAKNLSNDTIGYDGVVQYDAAFGI